MSTPITVQEAIEKKVDRQMEIDFESFTKVYTAIFGGSQEPIDGVMYGKDAKNKLTIHKLRYTLEEHFLTYRRDDYLRKEVKKFMQLSAQMEQYLEEHDDE